MSPIVLAVLGITLGFPMIAMVAIVSTGGVSSDLLTTFLVGGVVMTFIVGAIFEIKRLADGDGDGNEHPGQSEIILAETLAEPRVYAAAPVPLPHAPQTSGEDQAVPPKGILTSVQVFEATAQEPIVIEAAAETPEKPVPAKKRSPRPRKIAGADPAVPAPDVVTVLPAGKPKSPRRKRPEVV